MTTAQTTTVTLPLADIKPYWRNPRNNRAAVEKVKKSIKDYGYNQLIAVDTNHVIIVGHTRYLALKALGYEQAQVVVLDIDPKKAGEYRIVDNKTAEFAEWTEDLIPELRALGNLDDLQEYFRDDLSSILGESVGLGAEGEAVTTEQLAEKQQEMNQRFGSSEAYQEQPKNITCPHCGADFSYVP